MVTNMLNFNDFNFEVLDIPVHGTPDMFLNQTGVTFTKKVVEDMGYPQYVRHLLDVKKKAFAIQVCKENENRAMKFSKPKGEQKNSVEANSKGLFEALRHILGDSWHKGMRYRVPGIYFPDAKAMVFDLAAAEELPPLRPSGSGQVDINN
jgi:hypothetical protein